MGDEQRTGEQTARETGKKILAAFVWQQQAEEPQGHANERRAFQHRGEEAGGGLSRAFSRIPELGEEGDQQGKGSLRGQGSELSRDPTTTNAALIFKLFSPSAL